MLIHPKRKPTTPHVTAIVTMLVDPDIKEPLDKEYEILLVEKDHAPFKDRFAFPGGYVTMDEEHDPRIAVLRILKE